MGGGERELDEELARLWQEVVSEGESQHAAHEREVDDKQSRAVHPTIYIGFGTLFVVNLAMLLSLPPVLRGKGVWVLRVRA